jgi:hypothetical protein
MSLSSHRRQAWITALPAGTRPRLLAVLLCFASVLAVMQTSCRRISERTLRDTEGRQFSAVCDREQACKFTQTTGPKRSDKPALMLHTKGRLLGMCDVVEGTEVETPADCRPLVCKEDSECPPGHGMRDGQCLNGFCSDPANQLETSDAVMLCLAGTGTGRSAPRQVERYALALNCGSPCKIPAPCRQP